MRTHILAAGLIAGAIAAAALLLTAGAVINRAV